MSIKKISSLILTILIAVNFCVPVSAQVNQNARSSVNNLRFSGKVTKNEKALLTDAMIYELSKDKGEIVSITKTRTNFQSENNRTGSEYGTLAVMPEDEFEIIVAAQRITEKAGKDNFKFVANAYWKVNPDFEFTDCIGIAWTDEFTLYDDYAYTITYDYSNGIPLYNYDACTLNDVSGECGVAYDVNLILGERQDQIVAVAKVYKDNTSGSANVVAEYGHVILRPSSVGVSFGLGKDGPSIGMDVGIASAVEKASPDYTPFDY
jgi:hypothetical protein